MAINNSLSNTLQTPFNIGSVSVTTTGTQLNYLNGATGTTGTGSVVFATAPTLSSLTLSSPLAVTSGGTGLASTVANQILYSSATSTVAGLATANSSVLVTSSGGVPSLSTALPSGLTTTLFYPQNVIEGFQSVASAGGVTTLIDTSPQTLIITGVTIQTVVLPNATTLTLGQTFTINNNSTGVVTIQSNGGATITTMKANSFITLTILNIGTSTGQWDWHWSLPPLSVNSNGFLTVPYGGTGVGSFTAYGLVAAGTTSTGVLQSVGTGTSGQLMQSAGSAALPAYTTTTYPATNAINTIMYASSANALGSIAAANNSVLATNGSGVPAMTTSLPSGLTIPGYATSGANSNITSLTGLNGVIQGPTFINDVSGNSVLGFGSAGVSSVNYIRISNQVTLNAPVISCQGTDADIAMAITTKGIGALFIESQGVVPLAIASGTGYQHATSFSFANTAANRTVTFPDATGTLLLSDANNNVSANNFISNYATTATAAGTTTLTVGSAYQQFFTGSTTQTVIMPVTSTLTVGQSWLIVNNSSGVVTVQSSGTNNIIAMPAGTNSTITCIAQAGASASDWNAENTSGVAGVTSITGTTNQVVASAPSGAVTLSLPQSIATTSAVTFGSVTFSPTTQGIVGTTTNNNAAAGYVGEFADTGLIGTVNFTNSTGVNNMTSFSLTAGDWDVCFQATIASGSITTSIQGGISLTSAVVSGGVGMGQFYNAFSAISESYSVTGILRISLSTTTTVYLTGSATYSGTTPSFYCQMTARRVR